MLLLYFSHSLVSFRFNNNRMKMKLRGCKDEDIISLLELLAKEAPAIERAFDELAKPEAELAKQETGRKDIGKVGSPQKSKSKLS